MRTKIKDIISDTEEKELYASLLRAKIQHIEAKTSALLNKYEKGGIDHKKSDMIENTIKSMMLKGESFAVVNDTIYSLSNSPFVSSLENKSSAPEPQTNKSDENITSRLSGGGEMIGKQNEYLRGDDKHVPMPKSKQEIKVSIITNGVSYFTTELPEIPKKGDKIFKGSSLTVCTVNHTVFVLDKHNALEKIEVHVES